ncbi:CDP-alcohol phosphatidyltransferase family protein [Erythrobacter dokdonensis]|uniref:CDP-alcohol phosphatidyltransferase n=1 Tax=Erythrobacter dokdonensis DSW-74 TaxID=1300349 RepID=A0A1A7BHL5_9SPHN|nr:CDP-alcohol phosphatidyltransferase family protein [Erythrobacter dokdonensis]OBV10700.1 CDP-alcohol phosphatidyltransferase [Erythrobacter dokdonensis DSW-74]
MSQSAPFFDPSQRPARPAELEDPLNGRLYHPLSWRLARRLASTRISPDMVSAAGALTIILAAAAYGLLEWPWSVALGLALHMGWHVLDGADGDLARLTGKSSPHGELVDGICDYVGHIVLYVTMGLIAAGQIGGWGWALMWAAGASRVAQAAHYEGARRQYQLIVYGTPWMASTAPVVTASGRRHPFVAYYLWLTGLIVPHGEALTAAAQESAQRDVLRKAMRERAGEWLGWISPLSANYRTLAVGAAMLAGRPQWYFLFEVLVLGLVLLASVVRVRRVFGAVLAQAAASRTLR